MAANFHHVPGRLRVHVPRVKGNMANARALEATLSKINGVSRVESRQLTGSVVVHYDPNTLNSTALSAALGVPCGPRAVAMSSPRLAVTKLPRNIARNAAEAIAWHLVEKAAERAIPFLIAAIL
jgi:copper chaperone CopZ